MKLSSEQLKQRLKVLETMVELKRTNEPWLSLKEASEEIAIELKRDSVLLGYINALAASTTCD
jgi:hypothetical protein